MRVRVWISGADGPSRDFEMLIAPRVGERIGISVGGEVEEGVVVSVTWQLAAIEASGSDLALEGEPVGAVNLVHVVCHRSADVVTGTFESAHVESSEPATLLSRPSA